MLKALFENQKKYLSRFFEAIDLAAANQILEVLIQSRGTLIFVGIGKSGYIAEKAAATFLSFGIRSFFLNPANALHGDIGVVSDQDILIALSKSGASQELIDLLPYIRQKGAKTIGCVSSADSKLAKMCDLSIVLPVEREICPHNLAPTTSSAIQLIFLDTLAVALMQAKQFSVSDFARNHPGGVLGKKITYRVKDLMLQGDEIPLCLSTDPLIDCLHELSIKRCGCLVVVDKDQTLKGIFTDGDLRRAIQAKGSEALRMHLSEHMTLSPKWIAPHLLAFEAAKIMEEDSAKLITVLPVLDEGRVVGLIRMHDILQKELSP